jgi:ETFB lysine methyltransferase
VRTPLKPRTEMAGEPTAIGRNRRQRRLRDLLKAIQTSYDTVLQNIVCGELTIELLRVADVDTLLDRLPKIQFRPNERLPYWADLWPSSWALAKYLWEVVDLQGLEVLELGCGLGLAGVAASRKGGAVTFTDYEADALAFTRYNAYRNNCQRAIVRHLDWHAPRLTQTYAVITASDVLYERANFHPLVQLIDSALGPNGQFILAEPNRPIARDFFRLLRDHGFQYKRATETVEVSGEAFNVSIYHGGRKQPSRAHGQSGDVRE